MGREPGSDLAYLMAPVPPFEGDENARCRAIGEQKAREAAEAGRDPVAARRRWLDVFFRDPDKEDGRAQRVCRECPVRPACLDWVMRWERDVKYARQGVFGGLTAAERYALAARRAGTVAGRGFVNRSAGRARVCLYCPDPVTPVAFEVSAGIVVRRACPDHVAEAEAEVALAAPGRTARVGVAL